MIVQGMSPIAEALVKAASIPRLIESTEPFATPIKKSHAIIVGATHLLALASLFPHYAVEATIVIPRDLPPLDWDHELERAYEFEEDHPKFCKGVGSIRDLSGFNTNSADMLVICTDIPSIRNELLSQAHRVVRDQGKLIVFTGTEISLTHLGKFGMANPVYYPVEGFYVGTMRRAGSLYARN